MKCPYCQNTARRKVGMRNGRAIKVKCEVCDSHERIQARREYFQRIVAANAHLREALAMGDRDDRQN